MGDRAFCGACGTRLNTNAKFCASCGEPQEIFQPTGHVGGPPAPALAATTPLPTTGTAETATASMMPRGISTGAAIAATSATTFVVSSLIALLVPSVADMWLAWALVGLQALSAAGIVYGGWLSTRAPAVLALSLMPLGVYGSMYSLLLLEVVTTTLLLFGLYAAVHILALVAVAAIILDDRRSRKAGEGTTRQVDISAGSSGTIRSFWVGFGLSLLTLGIYGLFWYYFVNDELKDVGAAKSDENLAHSSPAMSVAAISIGGWLIFPPFLSLYNYGQRIKRAQRLGGVPERDQINPTGAFLLYFPGLFLILPYFVYFWYVTKHQNAALRANAQPAADDSPARAGAIA